MSEVTAKQRRKKLVAETIVVDVSFLGLLKTGELLSGTPTVAVSPSGPTLGTPAKNTTSLVVVDETCAASQAITFTVAGGTADVDYVITVTCATDAGATRVRRLLLDVVSE